MPVASVNYYPQPISAGFSGMRFRLLCRYFFFMSFLKPVPHLGSVPYLSVWRYLSVVPLRLQHYGQLCRRRLSRDRRQLCGGGRGDHFENGQAEYHSSQCAVETPRATAAKRSDPSVTGAALKQKTSSASPETCRETRHRWPQRGGQGEEVQKGRMGEADKAGQECEE